MLIPRWFKFMMVAPVYALLLFAIGCGGKPPPPLPPAGTGSATAPPSGDKTPVESKATTTLRGKVTFDGDPPNQDAANADAKKQVEAHKDKDHCLKDETMESFSSRLWKIGKDGGVANVVVFVLPPAGTYFKVPQEVKDGLKEVKVDQPFCAFEPYVSVACPEFYDGEKKKLVETGQVIKAVNSASISHNTKWQGDTRKVPGGNITLQPKNEVEIKARPSNSQPIILNCDIHKWMQGYIWALDTPFAAVTKADGTFVINNVPAGAEVHVVAWHEKPGFFLKGGRGGDKHTLKEGEHVLDLKVK